MRKTFTPKNVFLMASMAVATAQVFWIFTKDTKGHKEFAILHSDQLSMTKHIPGRGTPMLWGEVDNQNFIPGVTMELWVSLLSLASSFLTSLYEKWTSRFFFKVVVNKVFKLMFSPSIGVRVWSTGVVLAGDSKLSDLFDWSSYSKCWRVDAACLLLKNKIYI